ncbi:MAG: alpha/beta hydrolase [Myxococcales bacterium]|nr:alpha/beta hydrolase [Myxococcales bacterium]
MNEWTYHTGPRGLLLRCCEWNPEALGPCTVILHGFLEQGAAWDAVARRLTRRVVAPDQRGHGRSGHVGGGGFYHFWDYVSDLDALVEHLGAPIRLVGHSMGGTVACLYAGTRPEAVERLVLVEGLGPPDMADTAVDRARRFLADRRRGSSHRPLADAAEGAARMRAFNPNLAEDVALGLARRATRPAEEGVTWTWDALHRARSPVPFQADLFRRFLANITAPTLLVRGGVSTFVVEDEADRAAELTDARSVVIDGAGHLVHHDSPAQLAQLIEEHCS